ncbi:SAM-dependent methyltransferase protein [Planctomycetales bacterium 10988]|nr:SAM-dependent methyltransferase protein [Planctomycetales bacterium 10988]
MSVDFRACLYALSDVIINRPKPLRHFDQIYMKLPDMLLQAELISRWFDGKSVLFIGDGDAIGLAVTHLAALELLPGRPQHITVLDFDERVVNSVNRFAEDYGESDWIRASLYNVADALPKDFWHAANAFYTNPPWGASNNGSSVKAFIERGIEGVQADALGCIVIGDHPSYQWTHEVQVATQNILLEAGFRVAEMLPEFHRYHLDDDPELTSCSLIVQRQTDTLDDSYTSRPLSAEHKANFYGSNSPLLVQYVRDPTNGGKLASRDVTLERLETTNND